jgi:hypothetical protein
MVQIDAMRRKPVWNAIRRLTAWLTEQKREHEKIATQVQQWKEEVDSQILPLSLEEAQLRAEALLADPAHFRFETRPPTAEERLNLQPFARRLQGFLEQYAFVQPADIPEGILEDYLARSLLRETGEYGELAPFILIGVENGGHSLIVAKPGEETVYYLADPADPDQPTTVYPSIYHFLLARDRLSRLTSPL